MKVKNTILVSTCILLLSSCVIKSLNPFYTKKTIYYDENLIGEWDDSKNGTWKIVSFKEEMLKENDMEMIEIKNELSKIYKEYQNSYYIQRTYDDIEVLFIATPFTINNQTFLDFFPLDNQGDADDLLQSHSVYTHSLVQYDFDNNEKINLKWLAEKKIENLFKEKKIKIKHETFGLLNEKYLLTASSKELQKFLEKYMNSKDDEKWNTSTKYTLSKIDAAK